MMLRTHLAIALFVLLFLINYVEYKLFFIIIFAVASALPDADSGFSTIGKMKATKAINFLAKHRGSWHSFSFCLAVSILIAFFLPVLALPFFVGYSVHLFADSFTKEGIAPFWPLKKRSVGWITTGGTTELGIFAFFIVMDIIVLAFTFG